MKQVCPKCRSKDISFSMALKGNRGAGKGYFLQCSPKSKSVCLSLTLYAVNADTVGN